MNTKPRIGINAWVLRNKSYDGIGYFTINTVQELCKNSPELDFYVFVDFNFTENFFDDYSNCKIIKVFPPLRHPILYIFMLELIVPLVLAYYRINLFVGMDGMISLLSPVNQIPVIHDMNFYHFPENLPLKNRFFYNYFFPRYAKKAKEIFTVSKFSKDDIVSCYNIDDLKIHVVYCGTNSYFKKISETDQKQIKQLYTNGREYFVCLGTIHPRKNIVNLLRAYRIFLEKTDSETMLVIIGKFLWDNEIINREIEAMNLQNKIIFTGRINDVETQLLLGGAKALVFISLFEGFGMPLIEAFSAEVPVICSNTTSLNEISGNAAIKVDPLNVEEIASAMQEIDDNENIRNELILKGIVEKEKYSWERTGMLMNEVIIKAFN